MEEREGEQRCSVTAEMKAQAGSHPAALIHQKQLGISSCRLQDCHPWRERAQSHTGLSFGGRAGESCWLSEGRRSGQAARELSGFPIAVGLFCQVSELKQPQQDQAGGTDVPERTSGGMRTWQRYKEQPGNGRSFEGLVCPSMCDSILSLVVQRLHWWPWS